MSNDYSDINNYIFEKEIGEGNFGKVKLAKFKPTGEEFAIKVLNKKKIKKQMKNVMLRENDIVTKLHHVNVVSVYKIIETEEDYFMVMEYCKLGELFDYIVKKKRLDEEEASAFFYQLINGVEYIHSQGYAHRDLKPENLLLTEDKVLKIIDFGLSHEFSEDQFLKTKCGSPSYAAPEIISMPNYNGFKIDIWCCGIILYAMLCGYLPFDEDSDDDENNFKLFKNILECEPELPNFLSNISKDLIFRILNPYPEDRISIKKIKKHPFYLKGKKLCKLDYSAYEKEINKTRKSFYNITNPNDKTNNIEEKNINLDDNSNNINKTDANINIKYNDKNSIEDIAKNNYKYTINIDKNNSPSILENIDKVANAKMYLLSLLAQNKKKNDFNSFKKKIFPINLYNYNQKKIDKNNYNIDQILKTDINKNHHLPFIHLSDAGKIFNGLLSPKSIKSILDNSKNNNNNIYSTIVKKIEDEKNIINTYKSPIKYEPEVNATISRNTMGFHTKSCPKNRQPKFVNCYQDHFMFENRKNKNNFSINKGNLLEKIYRKYTNINNNTFIPGKLVLSLNDDKSIIKKMKFNKYEYDYNFNTSPNQNLNLLTKESYTDGLNTSNSNNMNNANNFNFRDINTIETFSKRADQNLKSIIKKYYKDNKINSKSPEIRSIFNNIKINNSHSTNKNRNRNKDNLNYFNVNNNKNNNVNITENGKNSGNKLYLVTDSDKDMNENEIFKKIILTPRKNYNNNSERSNNRQDISLIKSINKKNRYNFTKIIQNLKKGRINDDKKGDNGEVKTDKSFLNNHSSDENDDNSQIKSSIGKLKLKLNNESNTCDKRKKKEELLRYILSNSNKYHINNFKNHLTINNNHHILPKLNDHIFNNQS